MALARGEAAQPPNPLVPHHGRVSKHGAVITDPATGRTTKDGVWAGGDDVTGAATVIEAMGAGRRPAADIDAYVKN